MPVSIKFDFKPLERYLRELSMSHTAGHNEILIRWIVRYKKFAKARFNANSKGGGMWPALSKRTKKQARKKSRQILKDSDTLSHTLDPIPTLDMHPRPGIQTLQTINGVEIAFGGGGSHPFSKLSVSTLAETHQLGKGNNPTRVILLPASVTVAEGMKRDVLTVQAKLKRKLGMT